MAIKLPKGAAIVVGTKEKILAAAKELFLVGGFAGTSIGAIAKRAGINQSLIYHHFEHKSALWQAVKGELYRPDALEQFSLDIEAVGTWDELINELFVKRMEIYGRHPDLLQLMKWQMLEHDQSALLGQQHMPLTPWLAKIGELQRRGEIPEAFEAPQVFVLLVSLVWGPYFTDILGLAHDEAARRSYINFVKGILSPILSAAT